MFDFQVNLWMILMEKNMEKKQIFMLSNIFILCICYDNDPLEWACVWYTVYLGVWGQAWS